MPASKRGSGPGCDPSLENAGGALALLPVGFETGGEQDRTFDRGFEHGDFVSILAQRPGAHDGGFGGCGGGLLVNFLAFEFLSGFGTEQRHRRHVS